MVGAALVQVLPNAADVAAGVGTPAHLHQLRVGLRRLRTAMRLFGEASDPRLPRWEEGLARLFTQLGAARDRDVLAATVVPMLQGAGAPWSELPPATAAEEPAAVLRAADSVRLLLELLAFAHSPAPAADPGAAPAAPLSGQLLAPLRRLHQRLRSDAKTFLQVEDESRHRTRKRAKRLRYGLEFASSLLRPKPLRRYLDRLRVVQDALGAHNDLCVAEQVFRDQAAAEPRAWFAVGWLLATRTARLPAAAAALRRLDKLPKPADGLPGRRAAA
jgi:CHAD domain-containing protein